MSNEVSRIEGVELFKLKRFRDNRGEFMEVFRQNGELQNQEIHIKQLNKSISHFGVLRGIHIAPFTKVVHLIAGTIQQVVLDCRKGSGTFGKYVQFILQGSDPHRLIIPAGCGNAFCVLNPQGKAIYFYSFTQEWYENCEQEVSALDPELNIPWMVKDPIISQRDKDARPFSQVFG